MVTRHNIEELSKPTKINVGYHPEIMQQNPLAVKTKEVEAVEQAPCLSNQLQYQLHLPNQPQQQQHLPSQWKHHLLSPRSPHNTVLYALPQENFA